MGLGQVESWWLTPSLCRRLDYFLVVIGVDLMSGNGGLLVSCVDWFIVGWADKSFWCDDGFVVGCGNGCRWFADKTFRLCCSLLFSVWERIPLVATCCIKHGFVIKQEQKGQSSMAPRLLYQGSCTGAFIPGLLHQAFCVRPFVPDLLCWSFCTKPFVLGISACSIRSATTLT